MFALQLMGEASHLQQPGDFITSLVTDRPFVACINQQGQLKAYHNVCSVAMCIHVLLCITNHHDEPQAHPRHTNGLYCRFAGTMLLLFVMMHMATHSSSLARIMVGSMVSQLSETLCCLHACISHDSCLRQDVHIVVHICCVASIAP